MSHTPHELSEEFPDAVDKIAALKRSNAHFAKLADEYHTLNRTLHRIETRIAPTDDLTEARLRKQRLALKDEIHAMLSAQD